MEGAQYKIYQKVTKAFKNFTSYDTRFKSISFDGDLCTVQARKAYKNDLFFEVSFRFNSKTTVASIGNILKEMDLTNM